MIATRKINSLWVHETKQPDITCATLHPGSDPLWEPFYLLSSEIIKFNRPNLVPAKQDNCTWVVLEPGGFAQSARTFKAMVTAMYRDTK